MHIFCSIVLYIKSLSVFLRNSKLELNILISDILLPYFVYDFKMKNPV